MQGILHLIRRRPLAWFVVLAYGLSWWPSLLEPHSLLPLGPLAAAILVLGVVGGLVGGLVGGAVVGGAVVGGGAVVVVVGGAVAAGGAVVVGRSVVRHLVAAGHEVSALARSDAAASVLPPSVEPLSAVPPSVVLASAAP